MEIKMDIISELNGKRILIWGYGREGKATEHFLQRCVKPASVDIFEGKKEEIDEDDYDFIIKSPGIVMNEENPKYTSETELFLQQFRDQVIGITGTKGKSTTSAMLYTVLKACSSRPVLLLGNIGQPCLDYFEAKSHIAAYQKSGDYFFVGENVPQIDTKAQRTVLHQPKGVHYELKLAGEHNQYDAQFVERVAELLGCEKEAVLKSMADFEGLPHRLQYVGTYRGVRYYDDSISTIPEAAINAAMSIPDAKTVLIGGMDRGINYDLLVAFIRKHKEFQFICAYASGKRIFGEVGDCENCVYAEDLEQAVEAAVQMTEPGGACILSPAAASYGYFKNFEERGETFQKYVHAFAQ